MRNSAKKSTDYLKVTSWITYDFSNTIFSMNVVSLYFAPWMTIELGKEDIWVSLPNSISMLLVALTGPFLGEIADYYRKKGLFLRIMTVISVVFCASLTFISNIFSTIQVIAIFGAIIFGFANYGYQSALIFYNGFLPEISNKKNIGKISGWGAGIGYMGALVGLMLVMPFNDGKFFDYDIGFIKGGGRAATFLPTAILFLLFSLPALISLKDKKNDPNIFKIETNYLKYLKKIRQNFIQVKDLKYAKRFLIARFFYHDAIETVIIFMALYTQKVIGMTSDESSTFLAILIPTAVLGGAASGYIVDLIGAKKTLIYTLIGWIIGLVFTIFITNKGYFYVAGAIIGICLGAAETSSRPFFIALIPEKRISELFGFYSLSGRAAAISGPMVWGIIVLIFAPLGVIFKYRIAIFSLSLFILLGLVILFKIPENGFKNEEVTKK